MTSTATYVPWNAQWHLRAEMTRLTGQLGKLLEQQRRRGRSTNADAVGSMIIESGETEGLIADLATSWSDGRSGRQSFLCDGPSERRQIAERAGLGATQGCFLPLLRAISAFELDPAEYDALLLALAVELDPRCGRLVAFLNDHAGHTRPTLGLAVALAELESVSVSPVEMHQRPIFRDGLLELSGDGPLPSRVMRLDHEMTTRLTRETFDAPASSGLTFHHLPVGSLPRLVLPEDARRRLESWVHGIRVDRAAPALLLAGGPGSGRTAMAAAAAGEAGLPMNELHISGEAVESLLCRGRREARWYGSVLLVKIEQDSQSLDWPLLWKELQLVRAPVVVEIDPAQAEAAASSAPGEPVTIFVRPPALELRLQMWRALLPPQEGIEPDDFERLAAFPFPPGRIARAIRSARAEVASLPPGQRRLNGQALEAACRRVGSTSMSGLAQKLPLPFNMQDLIVPDGLLAELELAVAWVRHQRQVLEIWGFARRVPFGRGLTALFSGPPGTGKTMAAQVLARVLGLDLYRIDLSRVMSKYIGETEKNLGRLFDDAYASGAILFFDEADAIFGKRTEVRDAHDRYANLEIGYLLQRMEDHDGITILATNRMRDMDEAFVRRFHFILSFPMPAESDRLRIWQGMFPVEAKRDPQLDLRPLARRFEISGAEIRNVVLAAAFLAAADNQVIGLSHLKRALRREFLKNGRVMDPQSLADL